MLRIFSGTYIYGIHGTWLSIRANTHWLRELWTADRAMLGTALGAMLRTVFPKRSGESCLYTGTDAQCNALGAMLRAAPWTLIPAVLGAMLRGLLLLIERMWGFRGSGGDAM